MTKENLWPAKKIESPEHPKIMSKPLVQILDEMDGNIRAVAEASRRAEEAAKAAKQAAIAATKASAEVEKRAEEARQAGQIAVETAVKAACEAAANIAETARIAKEAAEEATKKVKEAGKEARKNVEVFQKAVEEAIKAVSEANISQKINSIENRLENIEENLQDKGRIYNATIYELCKNKYSITTPIQIIIIEDEGEVVARIPELNLYATGDTDTEAIYELKQAIIELYEDLNKTVNKLGPLPKSWLDTLNKLIVKNNG